MRATWQKYNSKLQVLYSNLIHTNAQLNGFPTFSSSETDGLGEERVIDDMNLEEIDDMSID